MVGIAKAKDALTTLQSLTAESLSRDFTFAAVWCAEFRHTDTTASTPKSIDTIVIAPEQNRIDLTLRAVVGIADTAAQRAAHPKEAAHGA